MGKYLVNRVNLGKRVVGYEIYNSETKEVIGLTEKQIKDMLRKGNTVYEFIIDKNDELQLDKVGFHTSNIMIKTGINQLIRYYRWFGGKLRVVNEITALIPPHITSWYEACCGSAAVTLNKARHPIEVVNDLDREIVNLFTLMADRRDGANLLDRLLHLRHSKANFMQAKRAKQHGFRGMDAFQMAEMTYTLISQSFNADRKGYANGITQRDYRYSLEKNLPLVYKRLDGVHVKSMDAVTLVDKVRDNPNAFVLLDVPYLPDLRAPNCLDVYGHEMSTRDHLRMLEVICNCKCKIMLCGYRNKNGNDLYDKYLLPKGWKHYKLADLVKTCQTKKVRDVAEEWVWLNYEPPTWAKYTINLDSANWS